MKKILVGVFVGIIYLLYIGSIVLKLDILANILSPMVTIIAAYYVLKGFILRENNRMLRIAAVFLALSIFTWFLCDVMWALSDMVFNVDPEQVDIITYGYSATNILLLLSLIISGYQELKRWNGIQILIDTLSITMSVMILVWVIFFDRDMQKALLMKNDWIAIISIISDFLIFIWLAIWYFSVRRGKMPLYLRIAPTGAIVFIITDFIYYYQYYYSSYEPNGILDALYVLSFAFFGLGAIIKMKSKKNYDSPYVQPNVGDNGKGILLILAPIILVVNKGLLLDYLLILVIIIVFYYFLSNYVQNNIYRDKLLQSKIKLNGELEQKVKERTKELEVLLDHDVITGLYSRRYFLNKLDNCIEGLSKEDNILLYYIDLNKYKMINTMFGKYIGEKTLIEVGKRLNTYKQRRGDMLASYGEDVFVLAIKRPRDFQEGLIIAEQLIQTCSDIYQIEEYDIRVTVNIGLSIYPLDANNKCDLIKHADIAMSQARLLGFNRAMAFDKILGDVIFNKNNIEMMLKRVKYDLDFSLHYQPQVSCENGELVGFEALIRWKTKDNQWISPVDFIPIAEETGCIIPIGYWVMEKAIEQLAKWQTLSLKRPRMAINISVKQLNDRKFLENLGLILDRNQMAPERIELEITESIQLEQNKEIQDILQKISKMGISIAIDDFGTGYSSLYYLKNLPINRIKIAKPLVDNIDKDPYDRAIIKSAIDLAEVRKISVIAEGVETKEQWQCLKELNCDEIQGYYFAKPMPEYEVFEKWLDN